VAQYAFRSTYASSQAGKTLQRLHSQHEAREKIFVLNLYLRKKAKNPGFVRAKVEGEFRAALISGIFSQLDATSGAEVLENFQFTTMQRREELVYCSVGFSV
jgi:hypothetical protein